MADSVRCDLCDLMSSKWTTCEGKKPVICSDFSKPSDGLEPSTPSLPLSDEAGTAGKAGKPGARRRRKTPEPSADE